MSELRIKWRGQFFSCWIDLDKKLEDLKQTVHSTMGVDIVSQKWTFKGKPIRKTISLIENGITPGSVLHLLGTSPLNEFQRPPSNLDEDTILDTHESSSLPADTEREQIIVGLQHHHVLGYLNSIIQILKVIPELRMALLAYQQPLIPDLSEMILLELKNVFTALDSSVAPVNPSNLYQMICQKYPQFDITNEEVLHDSAELMDFFLEIIQEKLVTSQLLPDLFTTSLDSSITYENELMLFKKETQNKLYCVINNQGNPIPDLFQGLKAGLEGEENFKIHKSLISGIPEYLIVQGLRFVWKEASIISNTPAVTAKILRAVSFPEELDLYELCTQPLKASFDMTRELEASLVEEELKENMGKPRSFVDTGVGIDNGKYKLVGIISHQGTSADAGSYAAWTRQTDEKWLGFQNEDVLQMHPREILSFKGGINTPIAYLFIYKKLKVINYF